MDKGVKRMQDRIVPEMLPLQTVSDRTGISYGAIRNLCLERRIVHIRIGRKYLVNYEKFLEYLNTGEEVKGDAEINETA